FTLTAPGEAFARRAVGPTLAAAGIGLAIGDLATASAILRPDYATGPGLGASIETLHDIAECALEGVVIRDASAFRRIAEADVFLFDDHPILSRPGLEVRSVERLDGLAEDEILRLAASAFAGLADERTSALGAACAARRAVVRRDPSARYGGPEITLTDRARTASIRDRRAAGLSFSATPFPPDLEVAADGRPVGRIAFGSSPAPRAAEAIGALRQTGRLTIGLLSHRPAPEAGALAGSLGMDFHLSGLSPEAAAEAVRTCRRQGRRVVYIGDALRHPEAAREADVAISLADPVDPAHDPAQVLILRPDLDWAAGLRTRASAHVGRVRSLHSLILVPNLACVAGAFFLGFTSLSAVLLTNLGTLAIYAGVTNRPRPAIPAGRATRRS
ncbi:MAG: HAD family hydrolase, partial [Isosphaeraceae bacterium]